MQASPVKRIAAHGKSEGSRDSCTQSHDMQVASIHTFTSTEEQRASEAEEEAGACEANDRDAGEGDFWMPGSVQDIFVGGGETQAMIEQAHDMDLKLAVILWHATWSPLAAGAMRAIRTLAERHQHVMFLCLDVEDTRDNRHFAFEKVRFSDVTCFLCFICQSSHLLQPCLFSSHAYARIMYTRP